MGLVQLNGCFLRVAKLVGATGCAMVAPISLWRAAQWQSSIRELMGLEPADRARPIEVSLIALTAFAILIALARRRRTMSTHGLR